MESSGLKLLHGIAVLIIRYYKVHHWNQEEDETWRNIKDDTTITMMWILSSLLYFGSLCSNHLIAIFLSVETATPYIPEPLKIESNVPLITLSFFFKN